MENLVKYLVCGYYYPSSNKEIGQFKVTRFSDIENKIIPFFNKYPILGNKALDYADFCKVAELSLRRIKHI